MQARRQLSGPLAALQAHIPRGARRRRWTQSIGMANGSAGGFCDTRIFISRVARLRDLLGKATCGSPVHLPAWIDRLLSPLALSRLTLRFVVGRQRFVNVRSAWQRLGSTISHYRHAFAA